MHADKRAERMTGTGGAGKTVVMGFLERYGEVRTFVVEDTRGTTLRPKVRQHVQPGSELHTDALASYAGFPAEYVHKVVDHAECYVKDNVHTNGLESFWSLLKRTIKGTHVAVEPFHLFRYLDEQARRYNDGSGRTASDSCRCCATWWGGT